MVRPGSIVGGDPSIGNRMTNARAETLAEKPSLKHLFGSRRCLISANGFYECRREGKHKVPMRVIRKDRKPLLLAGLWDMWRDPEGEELYTFSIITTDANSLLHPIHNRMPVIMDEMAGAQLLDPVFATAKTLEILLQPFPCELMEAYEVSLLVNDPRHDSPACIEPSGWPPSQARLI